MRTIPLVNCGITAECRSLLADGKCVPPFRKSFAFSSCKWMIFKAQCFPACFSIDAGTFCSAFNDGFQSVHRLQTILRKRRVHAIQEPDQDDEGEECLHH